MIFKRTLSIVVTLILVLSLAINVSASNAQTISVKLSNYIGKKTEVSFSFTGEHSIQGVAEKLQEGKIYKVKVEKGNLNLYNSAGKKVKEFGASFTVKSNKYSTNSIHIIYGTSEKKYLGDIKYVVEEGKYVRPININIPFEDYLKGVVPHEMPASWELEALKSQAVAARTYSAGSIGKTVPDTQAFQVYGGYKWYPNSTQAVKETNGKVLKYNGSLISAVFSSSNGGYTESNSNLWGSTPLPYLPAKKDSFDPQSQWSVDLKKDQIDTRKLNLSNPKNWWSSTREVNPGITNLIKSELSKKGFKNTEIKVARITNLKFTEKNSSGRSKSASITAEFFVKDKSSGSYRMEKGKIKTYKLTIVTTASAVRSALGTMNMKSTLVSKVSSLKHKRLGGENRFEVAVNVSKEGWKTSNTIILANWEAYGDALAATPLAYQKNAPILLSKSSKLQSATKQEIKRLRVANVIIVGGPISISKNIEKELKAMGIKSISRLGGKNRYEVSYNISKELSSSDTAIIAKGLVFADTLSVASYAAKNGYPIFLTQSSKLTAAAKKGLKEKGIKKTIVVGGELSVSPSVYKQLPSPTRIGGVDRYDVSANVLNRLGLSANKAFIATGRTFGDALTGSVLAAKQNANIVLTGSKSLPSSVQNALDKKLVDNYLILGGPISVSENIANGLPNIEYRVLGKGFGHGVGMSQYGAKKRAENGQKYNQILSFYYPGAVLVNK